VALEGGAAQPRIDLLAVAPGDFVAEQSPEEFAVREVLVNRLLHAQVGGGEDAGEVRSRVRIHQDRDARHATRPRSR
jgi:hypothetical protein